MHAKQRGRNERGLPPTAVHDADAMEREIEKIATLELAALRARWRAIHGRAPPPGLYRDLMVRSLAYRLQAEAYGDLDRSTKQMLAKLAKGDVSVLDPEKQLLKPGTILAREWNKSLHHVTVLRNGFAWNGETYTSLSATARAITGTNWNGYAFFGLKARRAKKDTDA